jgi:hypothetical protein
MAKSATQIGPGCLLGDRRKGKPQAKDDGVKAILGAKAADESFCIGLGSLFANVQLG